jgi:hypothetical protein
MDNNYYISAETIRGIEEGFMRERESRMKPGELEEKMSKRCSFCKEYFTRKNVLTGDVMYNEHDQPFHTGCYNEWCRNNPRDY